MSAQPDPTGDLLIEGAMVITMDADRSVVEDGSVAIDGTRMALLPG